MTVSGDSLRVILASTDIAFREAVQKTCYQSAATERRVVYHAVKHIGLTRKANAHIRLFENNTRSCCSVAYERFTVPALQQQVNVGNVVAVSSAEIAEHSGFIGYHQQGFVLFKQTYQRFGRYIINRNPAEVTLRDIAQVGLKFCYLLGSHIFLLFKSFQLAFRLRSEDILLAILVPVMSELLS